MSANEAVEGFLKTFRFFLGVGTACVDLLRHGPFLLAGAVAAASRRDDPEQPKAPASVVLVLASFVFAAVITGQIPTPLAAVTYFGRALVKTALPGTEELFVAGFIFVASELAIRALLRSAPKGVERPLPFLREVGRFLLASGLIWMSLYLPLAFWLLELLSRIESPSIPLPDGLHAAAHMMGQICWTGFSISLLGLPAVIVWMNLTALTRRPQVSWYAMLMILAAMAYGEILHPAFFPSRAPETTSVICRSIPDERAIEVKAEFVGIDDHTYSLSTSAIKVTIYPPRGADDMRGFESHVLVPAEKLRDTDTQDSEIVVGRNQRMSFQRHYQPPDWDGGYDNIGECVLSDNVGRAHLNPHFALIGVRPPEHHLEWLDKASRRYVVASGDPSEPWP